MGEGGGAEGERGGERGGAWASLPHLEFLPPQILAPLGDGKPRLWKERPPPAPRGAPCSSVWMRPPRPPMG